MYLIPAAPKVFNIKWDRAHTLFPGLPMAPASAAAPAPAALAVNPKVSYRASSGIPFTRPTNPFACLGCNCSGRGIGTPPQKKMGSNLRGLYGLRGATYNSATNYVVQGEQPAQVQAVASGMIAEGYSANIVNTLVAAGATAEDLQNLWDNYTNSSDANDPNGFGMPALQLLNQIYAVHPQGAGKPMAPSLTYGQALALTPGTIATAAKQAASGVALDVANLFSPGGAPSTGVPWYWWALGGVVGLEVLRRVL
jgi:hypothetical protein